MCLRSLAAGLLLAGSPAPAALIFETTSAYHHIRVFDEAGIRTLCFDDAWETRMSTSDPWQGHFEYTEYFHMPWLWKTNLARVLMIGLGGGSTQRSFEHYYPDVHIETVEIDPAVVQVARTCFGFQESDRQKVHVEDGRMFLRRSTTLQDLVIVDAYVQGRYGASIPQHLATKEFFELVRDRLTTNGLAAYNVIGSVNGWHQDIIGAFYRTLKTVFPQVYMFPAQSSQNVVLIATKARISAQLPALRQRAALLVQTRRITLPGFMERLERFRAWPPTAAAQSPVLTDDFAPVEGLAVDAGK